MDLPSLPRRQRALHGQRMQREFSFSAAMLAPLATHFLLSFCRQGMVRCEVISQGSACVTCAGLWAKTLQTRASVFEHNRDVAGVRFELRYAASIPPSFRSSHHLAHMYTHTHTRPAAPHIDAQPPQRLSNSSPRSWNAAPVSHACQHVARHALHPSRPGPPQLFSNGFFERFTQLTAPVQLGWSIILERHFGDSHAEAWDIISRRSVGLRSRCKSTFARYNPLTAATGNWHTILEFVARAVFLPSYMSWEEEFHCEEIDSDTAAVECMAVKSSR